MRQIDGIAEARNYHDETRYGTFAILRNVSNSPSKQQRTYPLRELANVIEGLDKTQDTWISQGEFKGFNRRVVNLLRTGVVFADLDTYRTPFREYSPETLAWIVVQRCHDEGLPIPSIILFSGRGLQVKWFLSSPVPGRALPRWNAVQKALGTALSDLGADPSARDASRVLRLAGTVNTKSGEFTRVIHVTGQPDSPLLHNFEELAEAVLPVAREQLRKKAKPSLQLLQGGHTGNLKTLNGGQLAWDRLHDLRKLVQLRGGSAPEGQRMTFLFWMLNFASLSGQIHSSQFWYESRTLAAEIAPEWPVRLEELSTLYHKAKSYNDGQMVDFGGRKYPQLYTPKNQHLIDLFGITDDEQQQLRTVITPTLARERRRDRDRKRDEARRRQAGAMERAVYESQSASKQRPWEALGMSRRTWYRKGKPTPNG